MQSRLAFAVCSHMDADLLLIDEVLAVGDVAFQRKCFERVRRARERGATIVLATHDTDTIRLLCDAALMLEHGRLHASGDPSEVVDEYLSVLLDEGPRVNRLVEKTLSHDLIDGTRSTVAQLAASFTPEFLGVVHPKQRFLDGGDSKVSGSRRADVLAALVLGGDGRAVGATGVGDVCTVRSLLRFREPTERFSLGVLIRDRFGQDIFGQTASHTMLGLAGPFARGDLVVADLRFRCDLRQGTYFVTFGLGDQSESSVYFYATDVVELNVSVKDAPVYGVASLPFEFVGQLFKHQETGDSHAHTTRSCS